MADSHIFILLLGIVTCFIHSCVYDSASSGPLRSQDGVQYSRDSLREMPTKDHDTGVTPGKERGLEVGLGRKEPWTSCTFVRKFQPGQ